MGLPLGVMMKANILFILMSILSIQTIAIEDASSINQDETQDRLLLIRAAINEDGFGLGLKKNQDSLSNDQEFKYYKIIKTCEEKTLFGMDWTKANYCSIKPGSQLRAVSFGSVDINVKKVELNTILSRATKIDAASYNGEYSVYTSDNKQYIINIQYPIQANPVAVWDFRTSNGETLDYSSAQ